MQCLEDSADEGTRASCLRCGNELETWGILGGPPPTFFCACCCRKFSGRSDETTHNRFLVSSKQAIILHGCTWKELRQLNFAIKRQSTSYEAVKLFFGYEARFLGQQLTAQRKKSLEALLDISLNDLDPLMRIYLLDDYLQSKNPRRMWLDRVLERYAVMPRVIEILRSCSYADPGADT